MELAQQLKGLSVDVFPCVVNYNTSKQKWDKHPVTVNGEPWATTAARALDDPAVNWHGVEVLGIPIPAGIVIIDLDCYKPGVTPESAELILGTSMPWDASLLQTTISGGRHYAFRLPNWPVKQGNNLGGPGSGIDTRVAGRGFICSGGGYKPAADGFGALRLAYPATLPVLPDGCRAILEQVAVEAPQSRELPSEGDRDVENVKAALEFIDPTERDTWRDIGFALKHYFHDDEAQGYEIWDNWSSGGFWRDGCPASYISETQPGQWASFRAVKDGATVTIGSLYHMALVGGWTPPARFDTAAAFGEGAAPVEAFNALIDRMIEEGADSKKTEELLQAIVSSGCNEVQAILLRNELKAMLKSAKLLDKNLSSIIDKKTTPHAVSSGMYDKSHTENAHLFLQANYPNNTLIRSEEVWFAYTGKCWAEQLDDTMDHLLTMAMLPSRPQKSTINGTYQMIASMVHKADANMHDAPPEMVVFQNGVLNIYTGELMPHDMKYLTTKIVPYNFTPDAVAPRWLTFVNEIFEGDQERIRLLQEWFGYMMSPTYEHHKIMLLIGPRRCGKGTIGNVLAELVGSLNYTGCSLSSFADDDYLDSLRHKTVAFSGDTAKNISKGIIDKVIERMKKISGNDHIDFGRKWKNRMTCKLPTRFTLAANHVPRLFDDSEALTGRMLVLPFEISFIDREDLQLLEALLSEIEGIALWSLQGLARLNAQKGFTVPEASLSEMQFIAEAYSPLRSFIDACCTLGTQGSVEAGELYDGYRAWAVQTGEERILPRKTFISAFKDATRGRGCRYGAKRNGDSVFRGFDGVTLGDIPNINDAAFKPTLVNGEK